MKYYKYFWIFYSVLLVSVIGCSGFQTKPYSLSAQKNNFIAEYCQAGKQKKAFKTTVLYFNPNLESVLAVNKASQINKKMAEQKNELLKRLFYMLGDTSMKGKASMTGEVLLPGHVSPISDDLPNWYLLVSENEKTALNLVKVEDAHTKQRLFTFIIKILDQNKVIIYRSNQNTNRMNYHEGYSTDLHGLMTEYTILTPKNIIEEITGSEFDSNYPYSTILLDENGEIDISKAISRKDDLWKSYIEKFTSIKEASEDNSKQSTIELTLDLNIFCKYGRKISDLQSQ